MRVREVGTTWLNKASVSLDSDQLEELEELAQGCLAGAKRIRDQVR